MSFSAAEAGVRASSKAMPLRHFCSIRGLNLEQINFKMRGKLAGPLFAF